ncbi:hypothetical protein Tco_1066566, partial [Tanacetum coccineum]
IASRGWSFASAVPGQMTHLVANLTLDSANSYVMQGASCTQRKISMVLFVLPSIMLLVVIVVTVVIVMVIPIVVVVAIVEVVVVVVVPLDPVFLLVLSVFAKLAACAFKAIATLYENNSLVLKDTTESFRIQDRYGNNGMSNPIGGLDIKSDGEVVDLTGDEDPTDEDGDIGIGDSTGVSTPSSDEIFSGGKKLQESDIGGGTIAGKVIITWDGGMASYACIYRSSCKGGKNSMSKRYLVKLSEELGKMFLGEAWK